MIPFRQDETFDVSPFELPEPRKYKAVLDVDLHHLSKVPLPGTAAAFDNLYFSIKARNVGEYKAELICKLSYAWDECSCAINFHWAKWASCFHDAAYQWAEALAQLWGCSVREVLAWADEVFLERMLQDADTPAARRWAYVYYFAVRLAGYEYHQLARLYRRIVGRKPLGIIKP